MNIAGTQYSLGYKSLEVYLSGCDGSCQGCHNPELWDFLAGEHWRSEINKIITKANEFDVMIDNIWILGGEPLLQDGSELMDMLTVLRGTGKKIWLFTRFEHDEIPDNILSMCDYVKCGSYDEELRTDINIQYGVKLATSNQYIKYLGDNSK